MQDELLERLATLRHDEKPVRFAVCQERLLDGPAARDDLFVLAEQILRGGRSLVSGGSLVSRRTVVSGRPLESLGPGGAAGARFAWFTRFPYVDGFVRFASPGITSRSGGPWLTSVFAAVRALAPLTVLWSFAVLGRAFVGPFVAGFETAFGTGLAPAAVRALGARPPGPFAETRSVATLNGTWIGPPPGIATLGALASFWAAGAFAVFASLGTRRTIRSVAGKEP